MGSIFTYPDGQIRDQNGNIIADTIGHSLVTTRIDHYLIHKGLSFIASDTASVTASANYDFILKNTTAFEVHLIAFHFTSEQANANIIMYKGVTTSNDGTNIPCNNMNFASSNTSDAIVTHTPTGLSLASATQIMHLKMVGSKQEGGTSDSGEREFILKQNEKVLFRYSNASSQTDNFDYEFYFLNVGRL